MKLELWFIFLLGIAPHSSLLTSLSGRNSNSNEMKWCVYDINHIYVPRIKNRSESDLRSCEVTFKSGYKEAPSAPVSFIRPLLLVCRIFSARVLYKLGRRSQGSHGSQEVGACPRFLESCCWKKGSEPRLCCCCCYYPVLLMCSRWRSDRPDSSCENMVTTASELQFSHKHR